MKILKILVIILAFSLLTILSQVGGIILLLWLVIFRFFREKLINPWLRRGVNIGGFVIFYLFFMFAIIPPLARIQDRVPLPFSKSGALVPVSYWTAIFGRNYIISEGRDKLEKITSEFVKSNPNIKVKYMDCNYPFRFKGSDNHINLGEGFPILEGLFPHLTHFGDKADIALVYNDEKGIPSNRTPTSIGYGSSVEPLPGEPNRPCTCKKNWKYSFMYHTLPRTDYELNNELSRNLILRFRKHLDNKIYFEPHLIKRFKLKGNYGAAKCESVRHDDHFHVQLGNL